MREFFGSDRLPDQQAQLRDQVGAGCRAEPTPDVGDVVLGRAGRDEDRLADLGIRLALQHQPRDLELALAEDFRQAVSASRRGGVVLCRGDRLARAVRGVQLARAGEQPGGDLAVVGAAGAVPGQPGAVPRETDRIRGRVRPPRRRRRRPSRRAPTSRRVPPAPSSPRRGCAATRRRARARGAARSSGRFSRIPCWIPAQCRCADQRAGPPSRSTISRARATCGRTRSVSPTRAAALTSSASGSRR